jgi:hypothetical protein
MPHLRLNLKKYRDKIYSHIFEDKDTLNDIISYLRDKKDINVTYRMV